MMLQRKSSPTAVVLVLSLLAACTALQVRDPPLVTVAGIEPLQGEGMELRLLVKLRVQNPNDVAIDYNGVSVEMDVLGKTFATGVSGEAGTIPRFGEAIVSVPVTASAFRMAMQAVGMMTSEPVKEIDYEMKGKLSSSMFSSVRFETKGTFELPRTTTTAR